MRLSSAIAFVAVTAGCGRVSFDPLADAGVAVDAQDPLLAERVVVLPMDDSPTTNGGVVGCTDPQLPIACAVGTCPASTVGQRNGAYRFTGTEAFEIQRPSLMSAAPFTISLWMRPMTDTMLQASVSKPANLTTDTDVGSVLVDTSGFVSFEWTINDQSVSMYTIAPIVVTDGAWHLATVVWNGSTRYVYVDGVQHAQTTGATFGDSTYPLLVGSDLDGTGRVYFFHGDLDELSFWDRALTDAEVATLPALQ